MEQTPEHKKDRSTFLIAMYNQLMSDINRHIIVIWQSVGVLFGAFAALSLVQAGLIDFDLASTLIVVVCIWVLAHVIEASYWYNRNLVIIANIERVFLVESDLKDIHYYFGEHRKVGRMIAHLRIQRNLALSIASFILLVHAYRVLIPICAGEVTFAWTNLLPWSAAVVGGYVWYRMEANTAEKYQEFLRNSPGRPIDTSAVSYGGKGHPV